MSNINQLAFRTEQDISYHARGKMAMDAIADMRKGQSAARILPFRQGAAEQLELLFEQARTLVKEVGEAEEKARELGQVLSELKRFKPRGISYLAYLKDHDVNLSREQADLYIRIYKRKTNLLEVREKDREKKKKSRAKRKVGRPTKRAVDSKEESACAINWENHREDDSESDAVVRARAVDWQLHEALRLADEFALRRPGTQQSEIKQKTVRKIASVIAAWRKLQREMRSRMKK